MTVTYEQFAEFLLKHSVYYYRPDQSVHCYIAEDGRVRYFANWGHGETRDYASLKSLYEATTGRDLPDAEDLAEVIADPLKFFRWAHEEKPQPEAAHHVITDAQFEERFAPVKNHLNPNAPFDGCMFETFGEELEFVGAQDPALVWTVIDCDGTISIESGCHFVNRLGYLVASRPRPDKSTYAVRDDEAETVTVDAAHLRVILDYLHDSEADHYDPETYPEEVDTHVYAHVLAIEAQLNSTEKGRAPVPNDVCCELAHTLTVRECGIRGVPVDVHDTDDDETRYPEEAQKIFDATYRIVSEVLEPYREEVAP